MSELISDNAEQRAFTAAAMNTLQCEMICNPSYNCISPWQFFGQTLFLRGFLWFGFSKFISLTVSSISLILPTRPYTDYCLVTPGNRGAAVVAGLNVIVFTIIAVLANKEKKQKKRNGELKSLSNASDSPTPTISHADEKRLPLTDEEDVTPAPKH